MSISRKSMQLPMVEGNLRRKGGCATKEDTTYSEKEARGYNRNRQYSLMAPPYLARQLVVVQVKVLELLHATNFAANVARNVILGQIELSHLRQ
mmetsp:Transcript_11420/g.23378  ORF Transcript_11420/g.23378 Transcript_11420/m.23378 type:complete len:94 (-) Transcript_11420:1542-1823(-)